MERNSFLVDSYDSDDSEDLYGYNVDHCTVVLLNQTYTLRSNGKLLVFALINV